MASSDSWYSDFVKIGYKPLKDEVICLFYLEPAIAAREAAGRIASESSCGTWTTLARMPKRLNALKAHAYWMKGKWLKVSYPIELFEPGSIPCFLSACAGNIFGMKAVRNLRLIDATFPEKYLRSFEGPVFGKEDRKSVV